jgi:hypothetical protein
MWYVHVTTPNNVNTALVNVYDPYECEVYSTFPGMTCPQWYARYPVVNQFV